jgi:short-subunit dehydrogenase
LDLIELNVKSVVSLTHFFLKDMLARNEGKILNVSSIVSKTGAPYTAVYSGTKAFILFFTLSIIKEIEDTNVTMTALMPGATDTDFFAKSGADKTVVYKETKLANPADVAKDAYDALMSGKTSIITGLKNKFEGFLADIMPYDMVTSMSKKEHSPSTKPESETRKHSDHNASLKERDSIERKNKPY